MNADFNSPPDAERPPAQDTGARTTDRPDNRSVENENQRPAREGGPPRPATEPAGAAESSQSPETRTDPGSGRS